MDVLQLGATAMVLEHQFTFRTSQALAFLVKLPLRTVNFGKRGGEKHGHLSARMPSRHLVERADSVGGQIKQCKAAKISSKHPVVASKGKSTGKRKPTVRDLTVSSFRKHTSRKRPVIASKEKNAQRRKPTSTNLTKGAFKKRTSGNPVVWNQAGILVDSATYASLLRQCGNTKDLSRGKHIHAVIVKAGLRRERLLANLLVQMYGKCGALEDASAVFAKLKKPNVYSWTIMIGAYAQCGQVKKAMQLLNQMLLEGILPNKYTLGTLLSACANEELLAEGKLMHAHIVNTSFQSDIVVGNALITMYAKCGCLEDAQRLFDRMPFRDVVSWNAMIAAYNQHGHAKEALQLFQLMQLEAIMPDKTTFVSILDACASQIVLGEGKLVHAWIVHSRLESDVVLGNALVNMYGKCGRLEDARRVLDKMPMQNVVSWTSMIAAYAQHGWWEEAIQLFYLMQLKGIIPNKITFVSVLSACACQQALDEGKRIHSHIIASGFSSDVIIGNALVNMYNRCGSLEDAQRMFDTMPQRNVISWTTMIAAYAQQGHSKQALQLFQKMLLEGIKPDKVTFVSILDAFTSQAALAGGKWMHAFIIDNGFELDVVVGTALINMYGNCGSPENARRIFDKMPERNLISWNAMIAAYAQCGQGKEALQLCQQMQIEGMIPDRMSSSICYPSRLS